MDCLRHKGFLLVCVLVLGLQFCLPPIVRAGGTAVVAEMVELVEECPEFGPGLDHGAEVFMLHASPGVVDQHRGTLAIKAISGIDREGQALQAVTGIQPSAP